MSTITDAESWIGTTLTDSDGRKLGTIDDVYADEPSGQPLWMVIRSGRFHPKFSFVPLAGAALDGDVIVTGYGRAQVEDAPKFEPADALPDSLVRAMYAHYGLRYDAPVAPPAVPICDVVARTLRYVN